MNDDVPALLTRRGALGLLGTAGATLAISPDVSARAQAAPPPVSLDCIVTPDILDGPYFVDERLHRSDITDGAAGVPLRLTIRVYSVHAGTCAPLHGAQVDLWHADAARRYSDEPELTTLGQRFLRCYTIAGHDGAVSFRTVYPGWYPTRAPHVHVKVRAYAGRDVPLSFATQLFFDDAVSGAVFAHEPYTAHGRAQVTNAHDDFSDRRTLVSLTRSGNDYAGTIALGIRRD